MFHLMTDAVPIPYAFSNPLNQLNMNYKWIENVSPFQL